MSQPQDRYSIWYARIRDAIFFVVGIGLLASETIIRLSGGRADPTIVTAGVTILLAAFTGVGGRWVLRRIENGNGEKK